MAIPGHNALTMSPAAGALLALAGAAGGGGIPWAMWALQAAHSPEVQTAVFSGARTAAEWVDNEDEVCFKPWQVALIVACVVITFVGAIFGSVCVGAAVVGGGFWIGGRLSVEAVVKAILRSARLGHLLSTASSPPSSSQFAQLADFISAGGQPAIDTAAAELAVSPEAVRTWWVQWQTVHRGPRRN
jgi:DNA-binding transcriptional regulator YdaS (Cro superfamily)